MTRRSRKSSARAAGAPGALPATDAALASEIWLPPLSGDPCPQEADLARLVAATGVGLLALDRDLRLRRASPAAVAMLHLQAADLGKRLDDLAWPLTPLNLGADAVRVRETLAPLEREARHPDGRWFLVALRPLRGLEPVFEGLVVSWADISRVRSAESHAGHHQLRALSQRLLEAQEAERRALAAEMHDEIGQLLTGLNLLLLSIDPQGDAAVAAAYLSQARRTVGELIARVRHLSLDLRPPMLDDLGLRPTLDWLAERYTAQTRVRVHLTQIGIDRRFSPMLELVVYRIIQEALTNVARHAETTEVTVRVWIEDDQLHVLVEDQGRGFDPAALDPYRSSGLSGMSERVALLGGTLTITSAPGAGTSIRAALPLTSPEQMPGRR
ncbi:MAG: ATP-binding protein [Oscillochloridaceae bacterium]|nr:ATP-binding protein [Chloroflexaceae bacterium]MDW8390837.1 ATP-binding protein [Oscillochloridaceae bacterium]